jgi:transcriptional regulator NrdR family protein
MNKKLYPYCPYCGEHNKKVVRSRYQPANRHWKKFECKHCDQQFMVFEWVDSGR